jgi:hypothetical protein
MATCPDTFQPKVCPQLQTRPSAGDCGPCTVIQSMHIASCGRFAIGNRERRIELIETIRRVGGSAPTGSSKVSEAHRAYTSTWAANQFAALGLRKPRATLMIGVAWSTFLAALEAGKWAHVGLRYGPIDAWNGGAVTGQPGYDSGHALNVGNWRMKGGNAWVTIVDPLADGRRAGIAKGPQAIRLSAVKDAMELFAGTNKATAYVFQPVSRIPGVDPEPTTTTVPNIVNVSEASALASLASAGLGAGFREEAYHASIVAGNVISSDPVSGVTVALGAEVDYVVSLGTAPTPPTVDPDPPSPCDDTLGTLRPCGCDG